MWDRQVRWNFKRDTYVSALAHLGDLKGIFHDMGSLAVLEFDPNTRPSDRDLYKSEREIRGQRLTELANQWIRLTPTASLALSPAAEIALGKLSLRPCSEGPVKDYVEACQFNVELIGGIMVELISIAKDELGLNTPGVQVERSFHSRLI